MRPSLFHLLMHSSELSLWPVGFLLEWFSSPLVAFRFHGDIFLRSLLPGFLKVVILGNVFSSCKFLNRPLRVFVFEFALSLLENISHPWFGFSLYLLHILPVISNEARSSSSWTALLRLHKPLSDLPFHLIDSATFCHQPIRFQL